MPARAADRGVRFQPHSRNFTACSQNEAGRMEAPSGAKGTTTVSDAADDVSPDMDIESI